MSGVRIAITGTPGVGKTTFCNHGPWTSISVHDLAKENDCLGEIEEDGAAPIDIETLAEKIVWPDEDCLIIDGHLSHLLPVDAAIVIRCEPGLLRERLQDRDYTTQKIDENVECELIGLIMAECLDLPCLELDSASGVEAMIASVEAWMTDGFKPQQPSEPIDWIQEIHGDD